MLPALTLHPELRCSAKSRRSGWAQCGRIACTGMTVCWTHGGARKKNRWGEDSPNFKHGKRGLEASLKDSQSIRRVRLLAIGLRASEGSGAAAKTAGEVFDQRWPALMEEQETALAAMQQKMKRK